MKKTMQFLKLQLSLFQRQVFVNESTVIYCTLLHNFFTYLDYTRFSVLHRKTFTDIYDHYIFGLYWHCNL